MPRRVALIFDDTLRPETTGTYCLRALRKYCDVQFYRPEQLDQIPRTGFDFYLSIDDGLRYHLPDTLKPCAWWVIDTHMDLPWAIERGQGFDWLFAAQQDGAAQLDLAGLKTLWLPLACDSEIHRPWPTENLWDVCFVGRVTSGPRNDLLQAISREFPRAFIGQCYFDDYARTCSSSLIGFNRSVKNDINMRVFETLGCGPLLITNDLVENGQSELFQTDEHLVTYRSSGELFDKLRFYIRSEGRRKQIAQAGHAEVIAKHTYDHRMQKLLSFVESELSRTSVAANGNSLGWNGTSWDQSVDFVVKSFLRPVALLRLIRSIRRHYPLAYLTIADDGNLRMATDLDSRACCEAIDSDPRCSLLELPFASGATAGRNHLIDNTVRPYLLFLDDDFEFTGKTDIKRLWDRLQSDPHLGAAAGACIDIRGDHREFRNSGGTLSIEGNVLEIHTKRWRDQAKGLREYFPQFVLIRRQVFSSVRWEGGIGGEHYDFCLQIMKSQWKVAHDLSVTIDHHPDTETLDGYANFRFNCSGAQQWLLRKWNLTKIVQDGDTIVELLQPLATSEAAVDSSNGRPQKGAPYFEFVRPEVAALVPSSARRVLDIGCGAGRLGQLLKERQPVHVTGLELQPAAAAVAKQRLDRVLEQNAEDETFEFPAGSFDCIICADVLEHLREPRAVLMKIRRWLEPQGRLVISLPNVRHHSVVSGLLDGNWTYESAGLLDDDHVRFFTRREIEKLLFRSGFQINSLIPKPGDGHSDWVAAGCPGGVSIGALRIQGLSPEYAEEFFTYQYLVVATPTPNSANDVGSAVSFSQALNKLRGLQPWPEVKPDVELPKQNLGWCGDATRVALKQELAKPTRLVVELGAWLGLSTRFIADLVPNSHVVTIDHWNGSPEHHLRADWAALLPNLYETFLALTWDYRDRVTPLRMTTLEGLQQVADSGLEPDLIYVDADHSYEAVTAELELCRRLFPRARLVGDDYDHDDVKRAVNDFAKRTGNQSELVGSDWRSWRMESLDATSSHQSPLGLTSIIIVTFNQLAYTKECVESIQLRTDEPFELIFIDNGSTDGSPQYLSSLGVEKIICNSENRGFPAAVNQGLKLAAGSHVLLLNNDTVVSTGWLRKMLDALESDPAIGLVGPCSNSVSGAQMVPTTYNQMTSMDGFAWDWGKQHAGIRENSSRLIGFCLLIRRKVIEQLGGLDERFGLGCFEDDDFCVRVLRAGWRAVIARDAFVHHYGSRTFAALGVDYDTLINENREKFNDKWNPVDSPSGDKPAHAAAFTISEAEGGGLLLAMTDRPRLSLCMIVRNNENTIRPCLESIRPWVDEMIIVDTGSIDGTPAIAADLGAHVFHWPWRDDFSAARNESISHAAGEWVFWMDSDDTIPSECGSRLRDLANGEHSSNILGYVIQVHCPGPTGDPHDVTAVDHVKLFRNRSDLRFEHRIHEQILPSIRRAGGDVEFTDIHVVHSGADHTAQGRKRKLERDFKLLELDLAERPDHPFVLFNLGMTCADCQKLDDAVHWLKRCVEVSPTDQSHVRKTYALLVSSLMQMGNMDEAQTICIRGRELFPDDKELIFRQAMLAHEGKRFNEAVQLYQDVLKPQAERHFTSIDIGIASFKARHNLALVFEDQNRFDLAEQQWLSILEQQRDYAPAHVGLIDCLIRRGNREEATVRIEKMRGNPRTEIEGYRMSSRLAELDGRPLTAIAELKKGIQRRGNDPVLIRELARLLHANADYEQAMTCLQTLTSLTPDDSSAWNNYAVVLNSLNRHSDARNAMHRADMLRQRLQAQH